MPLIEISADVEIQVRDAISKIRELSTHQVSFIQYVWSIIQTFSCSIIEIQSFRIKNIVTEGLRHSVNDFISVATENCIPRTQVFTEGAYTVLHLDMGKTLNSLVQGLSGFSTGSTTSSCVTNTALSLQRRSMEELYHQRNLIINKISSQSSQVIHFLTYGISIGLSSLFYLTCRAKYLLGLV